MIAVAITLARFVNRVLVAWGWLLGMSLVGLAALPLVPYALWPPPPLPRYRYVYSLLRALRCDDFGDGRVTADLFTRDMYAGLRLGGPR